jgi:hypothetical protein
MLIGRDSSRMVGNSEATFAGLSRLLPRNDIVGTTTRLQEASPNIRLHSIALRS